MERKEIAVILLVSNSVFSDIPHIRTYEGCDDFVSGCAFRARATLRSRSPVRIKSEIVLSAVFAEKFQDFAAEVV